jgi:hypothetical protein
MGAVATGGQLKSTERRGKGGPRNTDRTRYNAIRHGILAQSVVLEGENRQEYEDLRQALGMDLGAVGMLEEMWVDQLASLYWRLARLQRAEADGGLAIEQLHRYEVSLRNEMKTVLDRLYEAQSRRRERYPSDWPGVDEDRERKARQEAKHQTEYWGRVAKALAEPERHGTEDGGEDGGGKAGEDYETNSPPEADRGAERAVNAAFEGAGGGAERVIASAAVA